MYIIATSTTVDGGLVSQSRCEEHDAYLKTSRSSQWDPT